MYEFVDGERVEGGEVEEIGRAAGVVAGGDFDRARGESSGSGKRGVEERGDVGFGGGGVEREWVEGEEECGVGGCDVEEGGDVGGLEEAKGWVDEIGVIELDAEGVIGGPEERWWMELG